MSTPKLNHAHGRVAAVIEDLRKFGRNLPANFQRETGVTPSLLLAAAEFLEQRYIDPDAAPEMMCGRCKGIYPCICDEPVVYQRVTGIVRAPVAVKCVYADCTETKDLQVSHVCLKHILRDEEAHDRALANAFWDVLCTLEGYKYTDWELVADDADEEDPSRKLAERTEALIKAIITDVKTTAKALGVKPAPREELTKPSKEAP